MLTPAWYAPVGPDTNGPPVVLKIPLFLVGIQGLRFHDLRHTAATRMAESGIGIDKVSKILGHSSIQMTMRYSHPDNSLREAVEALANFRNSTTKTATNRDLEDAN